MDLPFDKFYLTSGVRTLSNLTMTRVWPVRALPIDSAVHFLSEGPELFPDTGTIYAKFTNKRILLKNYFELLQGNRSQGKIMQQTNNLILEFVQKNKEYVKFEKPLSEAKDEKQLVFCNFNLVKGLYRYQENHKLTYYRKWLDRSELLWTTVNDCCNVSSRNHFYDFEVPMELPSKTRLNSFADNVNDELVKYFPNSQGLFLLDIWKWLNPETREGSTLGRIETKNLKKCNILFHIQDGRSVVLNLGYLNSWVEGQPNVTAFPKTKGLPVEQIRLTFLKFLINLQALNVELLQSQREAETDKEDERFDPETGDQRDQSVRGRRGTFDLDNEEVEEEISDSEGLLDSAVPKAPKLSSKLGAGKTLPVDKSGEFQEADDEGGLSFEETMKQMEEEAKALEAMEDRRVALREQKQDDIPEAVEYDPEQGAKTPEEVKASVYTPRDPGQFLLERLDNAVGKGSISAADYRKVLKTLEQQANYSDPYGSGKTLKEMTTITTEDIQFDQTKNELVTDERILDKSMAKSTVEALDRDYVRKTMKKDIVASIMGIQSAGVMVTDVSTEEQNSVLGAFESHAITLKPIDGKTSTIRIKLPKVSEDGTFKSNGVRYHMRKQRVDLPIRKIDSERVGLSSFYGKLFVYRSPKKADSGIAAIVKQITAGSIGELDFIKAVRPAKVFDNLFPAPYIYSALASNYKSFQVNHEIFGELYFDFDHRKRRETLMPGVKIAETAIDTPDNRLVGRTAKNHPIFVNKDNQFVAKLPNGEQPLGDIFDILKMDRLKVPVDPAMVKVRGQSLPVGLVLARSLGLKNLLKFTNSKYRLVKGRQQKNLQPFEYAISFANYSLILDRRDIKSSLIFGGFDVAAKYIKVFPIESFEKKELYDDVFESMGSNITVTRELELLETSYVDPITRSILQEMKEPETFLGLLDRSCEMLVSYTHPDSQDLHYQQIRGYERFGGTIYREMIKSVRNFRNKNLSGRAKVEMSPFAVHQAIMEDRSVKTCEDINPIQNLKMHESVTFAGEGGRDKDAFMDEARAFTASDAGVISEASVDSGDVGYNIFMAANPVLSNVRGMRQKEPTKNEAGHYLSSSMMLAVGSAHDDQLGLSIERFIDMRFLIAGTSLEPCYHRESKDKATV